MQLYRKYNFLKQKRTGLNLILILIWNASISSIAKGHFFFFGSTES